VARWEGPCGRSSWEWVRGEGAGGRANGVRTRRVYDAGIYSAASRGNVSRACAAGSSTPEMAANGTPLRTGCCPRIAC